MLIIKFFVLKEHFNLALLVVLATIGNYNVDNKFFVLKGQFNSAQRQRLGLKC